jgi:hypothetical protein
MKKRILLFAVATFGPPLILLVAELISWLFQTKPFVVLIIEFMPDLVQLIIILWLIAIIYTSYKLMALLTQEIHKSILKIGSRVVGVIALTIASFFISTIFVDSFLSVLSVRSASAQQASSLTHHSSGTPNGAS